MDVWLQYHCLKKHSLGVLCGIFMCLPTERVPLNLIEVILAQGSKFGVLCLFSGIARNPAI